MKNNCQINNKYAYFFFVKNFTAFLSFFKLILMLSVLVLDFFISSLLLFLEFLLILIFLLLELFSFILITDLLV